ncbi:hypothetical protein CC86DRAFT_377840 [Ophiobolus disseminans]|uniref:Uncharacterized protein n=1 Tax=Ophiobolus disseminans TaxID=1469910 RepID=A0A6A7AJ34_9PLEO|nr:hypothetical protein CC86DRAFT_377840 [Ophiobolus disseminans]
MQNNAISLSSVVNRVQSHIHDQKYYLKVNKTTQANTNVSPCTDLRAVIDYVVNDRDYSAQEVCHMLLNLPLKHFSRAFVRPLAKERVLTYFPRYSPKDTENFSRAKLMLHYPFRAIKDLLYIEDIHNVAYTTFSEAYAKCRALCGGSYERDGLADLDFDQPVEEDVYKSTPAASEEEDIEAE